MATTFDVPVPTWADPEVWRRVQIFANEHSQDAEPPIKPYYDFEGLGNTMPPGIQRAWSKGGPYDRFLWLANSLAARITPGSQFGQGPLSPILDPLFEAIIPIAGAVVLGENPVGDIIGDMGAGLGDTNDAADLALLESGNRILALIGTLTRDSQAGIQGATASALSALVDTNRRGVDTFNALADAILGRIAGSNDSAVDALLNLIGHSTNGIDGLIGKSGDALDHLFGRTLGGIEELLSVVLGDQSAIVGKIGAAIEALLGGADDNHTAVTRAIERSLEAEVEQAQRNSDAITRGLDRSIEAIISGADSALSTTREALAATGHAQTEATAEGAAAIRGALQEGFGGLGQFLSRLTGEGDAPTPEDSRDRINRAFEAVSGQGNCPSDFTEFVHDFIGKLLGAWHPATPLAVILADVQLLQAIVAPAIQVLGNCLAQTAARALPTALNSPPELQDQMRRGLVDKATAMQDLLSQGFTPERADRMLAARRQLPEVGIIQTWFLRGMINVKTAFEYLGKLGFDADDSQGLLEMAYFIPPPADLITMAVREAFSPAVAQRFGQYEDFPEDFAKYAAQQGISKEWAQRYWAAHWSLPSPQQGFEMYQRDVIKFDDLQLLLKSLDVMPFWRDKLTQIAFRPITRVDIRRMHALKLLDHDGMVTRYRHMGYSPEDAAFMAKFTERLNAPKGEQDVEELEGATKATVLQLFRRGVITEKQAREILDELGTGERAMNVMLTNERTKLELEHRDEETDLVLEQAGAGVIDADAARDRLGSLGLTATELQRASAKLAKIEARQTRLPTRAEAEKMLGAKVISKLEYAAVLRKLGYSIFWTTKFVELADKG